GITVSGGFEWDTYNIIEKAWQQGKAVCVPKCYPKEQKMIFYRFQSFGELEVVYYNLKEPKPIEANKVKKNDLDLIIVPGLLFDSSGYRIGFGGGYYDRFLTDYRGQTVALTSSQLLIDSIPKESHDMAVSHIITEKGIIHVEEGN
ncbi:MAG TPA: 5-formyltetrahydrofolate cyclo-ligase, partial [Bacillota bacterium]|nr:5-formyltetrahydrofolate cyclo-ligase [Bacillota bacterium]